MILYGLMVFVLASVIIFLWQMQVFQPFGGKKGYVGFSQIVPEDWVVGSGKTYLSLINQGEAPLTIDRNEINVTIGVIDCNLAPATAKTLEPQEMWIVEVSCPQLSTRFKVGDYFEGDVSLDYNNLASDRDHKSVGKIYGHIEKIDSFTPTTRSTTTRTILPHCFYHPCNVSGDWDVLNCGDIDYRDRREMCQYCPANPVGGERNCWYNGACDSRCYFDRDCSPYDPLNLCKQCINGKCEEGGEELQCGPCPMEDWGTLTSRWCNITACPYCFREWIPFSDIPSDGEYQYNCEEQNECGDECINWGRDLFDICLVPTATHDNACPHCEPDQFNTSIGVCTQGDCGKHCGETGLDECNQGCEWCNNTGPNPSFKCEIGDCGAFCVDSTTCLLGCDVCYNNRCINDDIGINLLAHNGSFGKVVNASDTIYINITSSSVDGINKVIVSNSIYLTPGYSNASEACDQIRDDINTWFMQNGYPDPEDAGTLAALNANFGISSWAFQDMCFASPVCRRGWTTQEAALGSYCYVGLAQKSGPTGRWSLVDTDYIQVGYIDVYLVWPPPEVP